MGLLDRIQHAWNAFLGNEFIDQRKYMDLGYSTTIRPDRTTFSRGNEKSIVTAIYNRIAIDCSCVIIKHVQLDTEGRYVSDVKSGLTECLTVEANKDQAPRAFFQDIVMSLFDEGCIAVAPIDTNSDITASEAYDILSLRTGKIIQWYPDDIRMEIYNDRLGIKQELTMEKKSVAIIENPFYAVMNERNSVLRRLINKLNLLDAIDEQSGSGKLDLIIQLPYVIKSEARRAQADIRRKDIETQLSGSKYGVAYTDGTEKVTQLNRPVENNLMKQIEYLTSMLFGQLNISQSIMDGTADEKVMLNYSNRTIEPIIAAIVQEMNRKYLTKTARSQHKAIRYFNDPFRFVPLGSLADIADKFTRNEILTPNELRQIIGFKPSLDPSANELRNRNITSPAELPPGSPAAFPEKKVSRFKVTLINQGGTEETLEYDAENEEDATHKAMAGADVPKENIKKVAAV